MVEELAMAAVSTPRTFRIGSDVIKGLEAEARKQGATVNGLTCRILRKYITVGSKMENFGIITMTRNDLTDIVDALDDKTLERLAAKMGAVTAKEVMLQLFGELSVPAFKMYLELVVCGYMNWATYSTNENAKDRDSFEVRIGHNIGRKWSLFLLNFINAGLQEITGKKPVCKYISNYSLIFADGNANQ